MAAKTATEKAADEFRRAKTLWKVLALALGDARKIERRKGYRLDMGSWVGFSYDPETDAQVCEVCLGGAVIACRLPEQVINGTNPGHFRGDDQITEKLYALNALRCGHVQSAWVELKGGENIPFRVDNLEFDRAVISYRTDSAGWWKAMKQLLSDLKKARY